METVVAIAIPHEISVKEEITPRGGGNRSYL